MDFPTPTPKQRSEFIMMEYFPELFDNYTYVPLPDFPPEIKKIADSMTAKYIKFIQQN